MKIGKIELIGAIGAIGVLTSCMQLEYIEIPVEHIAQGESSSSSEVVELSSSSSEVSSWQIGRYELEPKGLSYYDAILLCNKMSRDEGLDTLYQHDRPVFAEDSLFWLPNIKVLEGREGYRLPTKEEWLLARERGEIEKLDESIGEWLYEEANSQYAVFELAPHFLRTVGLYREREGYPAYGVRVVRVF
ncbi:MAG: SUMF1/EgtB/PvdO family nonheme iron enzyme [Fibromonadaceae bacterium]|nr:SUMF1/EgtB/PvdO family nonheme iron enzyme [Fibromonadaceae bacterium]